MILRSVSALLLGVLCAMVVGCGSSGSSSELLRTTEAAGLKEKLAAVRQAVKDRDVGACAARLQELQSSVANLPDARRQLRTRLREEIKDKLVPATENQCDDPVTETIPTTTEPPPTETETTQSTETTPPPDLTTTTDAVPPPPDTTTTEPAPSTDPGGATIPDPGAGDPGGFGPSTDPGTGGG